MLFMRRQYLSAAFMNFFGLRPGEVAYHGKNKANHRFCWEDLASVLKYPDHEDGGVFAEVLIIKEYFALPKLKPELESVRVTTRTSKLSIGKG